MYLLRILAILVILGNANPVFAGSVVQLREYDADTLLNEKMLDRMALRKMDSLIRTHPLNAQAKRVSAITVFRETDDKTTDFYLVLSMFLLLGAIRLSNPRYFRSLLHSFFNPAVSSRQLKEQIQMAHLSNILMNLFFALSVGAYLYYIVRIYGVSLHDQALPSFLLILILIAGVVLIYAFKYLLIRLTGWMFKVESLTGQYLYNVFLVNKIIGIALLPFIVLMAFGHTGWMSSAIIVSCIVTVLLMLSRYIRSWQVFGSFFQFSKFHFFTYLCASELLPLAILVKLMVKSMFL